MIPLSLQRRVEGLLQEHLDRTILNSEKAGHTLDKMESSDKAENVDTAEHADSFLDDSVMEKVLQRRSLRMRNMQRAWQVCIRFECEYLYSYEPKSFILFNISCSTTYVNFDTRLFFHGCLSINLDTRSQISVLIAPSVCVVLLFLPPLFLCPMLLK